MVETTWLITASGQDHATTWQDATPLPMKHTPMGILEAMSMSLKEKEAPKSGQLPHLPMRFVSASWAIIQGRETSSWGWVGRTVDSHQERDCHCPAHMLRLLLYALWAGRCCESLCLFGSMKTLQWVLCEEMSCIKGLNYPVYIT